MIRKIIHIDEEKCNGCGLCATACHEGAIDIINGKAKLVRENFCDGFGDCLPGCPTGAITFEEREAPAYDEAAVQENKKKKELQEKMKHLHEGGCPGSRMRMLEQPEAAESAASAPVQPVSRLRNWPVQIKLAPVHAPYFAGRKTPDCSGLHGIRLRQFPSGVYARQGDSHRLPEAGCCGLQRKAHRDPAQQRHPERDHPPHGGALLRRLGDGRKKGTADQRKVHSVAGGHHLH